MHVYREDIVNTSGYMYDAACQQEFLKFSHFILPDIETLSHRFDAFHPAMLET